jgi:hypothetical protein
MKLGMAAFGEFSAPIFVGGLRGNCNHKFILVGFREETLIPANRVTTLSRSSFACEAGLTEETGLSQLSFQMLPEWTGRLISNTKITSVVDVTWYSLPYVTGQGESVSISCEDQLRNSSPNCTIWFAAEMDMGTIPDTLPSDWDNVCQVLISKFNVALDNFDRVFVRVYRNCST